jgi:predicted ArsR family transcriptional regulator
LTQVVEHNDGRGRPRHVYSLTAAGRALFPHHYDEFTNDLLREILISEGPEKVQGLLQRIGQRLAAQYAGQITADSPAARAAALTELLNARGILAEMVEGPDGIQMHEYTCPYYELAREHRAICDMEQDMLTHVIRQPVALVSCTLDGHHGCEFRIGTND